MSTGLPKSFARCMSSLKSPKYDFMVVAFCTFESIADSEPPASPTIW
jgi:hypothetical protein